MSFRFDFDLGQYAGVHQYHSVHQLWKEQAGAIYPSIPGEKSIVPRLLFGSGLISGTHNDEEDVSWDGASAMESALKPVPCIVEVGYICDAQCGAHLGWGSCVLEDKSTAHVRAEVLQRLLPGEARLFRP